MDLSVFQIKFLKDSRNSQCTSHPPNKPNKGNLENWKNFSYPQKEL